MQSAKDGDGSVEQLADTLRESWGAISKAKAATQEMRATLEQDLTKYTSPDTSLCVFGSLGRGEFTSNSDLDWVLLVDGEASPEHQDAFLAIDSYLKALPIKGPGAEALFGGLSFSHDLIHYIGGEDDTNRNLTLRMLLLLESTSVGRSEAHRRVIHNILRRYIVEDFGWMHARNPMNVPRFLHNDIVRYWRTLAVDFAYKRRQRAGRGWALRTAKLRISRKLTYASGILMCYSCATDPRIKAIVPSEADTSAAIEVVAHLSRFVARTPLDIFADFFLRNPALSDVARAFFRAYDSFLALLDDEKARDHLEKLKHDDVASDSVYQRVRELGHDFQAALNGIFFSPENAPELFELTKTYGVF